MNTKTKAIKNEIIQTLKREGAEMYVSHRIDETTDPITGARQGTDLKTKVWGVIRGFGEIFTSDSNSSLVKGDVSITITANAGSPKVGQYIEAGSGPLQVLSVRPIKVAADDVAYIVKARSYQETELVGVFTKQLRDLKEGELVRSVEIEGSPIWRVIGQGTYGIGLTLLLNDKLTRVGKKPFTVSGYPLSPWSETYFRNKIVVEQYLTLLDIKFQEAIQPVNIYTDNYLSSDRLFALSKVEMGFPADPGKESGTAIAYFTSDAYRVCFYLEDNLPYAYWTRDHYGVDAAGKLVTLNPGNEHYVRTCCNLRNSINVAKNQDNIWEIIWP